MFRVSAIALVAIALVHPLPVDAQGAAQPEVAMTAGLEGTHILRGSPGATTMVIGLTGAHLPAAGSVQRAPMSVALVIDRSGSMAGEKIVHAIAAARGFVGGLRDGDVVAIFQYDGVVEQLAAPTVITSYSRPNLQHRLGEVTPRGATNIHAGLAAGIAALSQPGAERPIRRIVLISDGRANAGLMGPGHLGAVAAGAALQGISVSTIGVGYDYDEAVLGAIAVRAGGRYYHLANPTQMAAILEQELESLSRTVARGVTIEVTPGPGVRVLSATGADLSTAGGVSRLTIGDLLSQSSRDVVLQLQVPTGSDFSGRAASLDLGYVAANGGVARAARAQVNYQLANSEASVRRSTVPAFAPIIARHRASAASQEAARLLEQGRNDEAGDVLDRNAARIRGRAAALGGQAGALLSNQATALERQSSSTRRARTARARRAQQLDLTDEALGGLGF